MLFSPNRPGRMRGKTLSQERVAGRSPAGCGAVQSQTWYRPSPTAEPDAGIPRPLLLGEGAAAAAGVEGTLKSIGRARLRGKNLPPA